MRRTPCNRRTTELLGRTSEGRDVDRGRPERDGHEPYAGYADMNTPGFESAVCLDPR
jgi:hypothetical protein